MKAYQGHKTTMWIFHEQFVISTSYFPIVYDLDKRISAVVTEHGYDWTGLNERLRQTLLNVREKAREVNWKRVDAEAYSIIFVKGGFCIKFKNKIYGFGKAEALVKL